MCWPSSVLQFAPRACLLYTESLMTGGYNYLVFAILACSKGFSLGNSRNENQTIFFNFRHILVYWEKGAGLQEFCFFLVHILICFVYH